jgi:hypothetical protein
MDCSAARRDLLVAEAPARRQVTAGGGLDDY